MPLTIGIAVAKTNKHASRASGDTVEIVERPGGGMSVVMSDGQGSGRAAMTYSISVTAQVTALLKEGVRVNATARAANDYHLAMRHGQVSATLDILSADLKTNRSVITRNGGVARVVAADGGVEVIAGNDLPLGLHVRMRPRSRGVAVNSVMT